MGCPLLAVERDGQKCLTHNGLLHSAPRKGGRPLVPCFALLVHLWSGLHAVVVTAVAAVAAGRGIGDGIALGPEEASKVDGGSLLIGEGSGSGAYTRGASCTHN